MLSAAERKSLKARAHKLEPVLQIGAKGITDEVVKEVDVALKAHELIKVRAPGPRARGARGSDANALRTHRRAIGADDRQGAHHLPQAR